MGCGNANNTSKPTVTPGNSLPPSSSRPYENPAPQPSKPSQSSSKPNPPPPKPSRPKTPPYTFPATYNPESTFKLQVKDLTSTLDCTFSLLPTLPGRELYELIRLELGKIGEQRDFQIVLYGRPIKNDQEEIGKSGLSVSGLAYCIFKP